MRLRCLLLALIVTGSCLSLFLIRNASRSDSKESSSSSTSWLTPAVAATVTRNETAKVSFESDISPILKRCQPCHFNGGTMYEKLPFDRAATVKKLGTKLFSRINDESERRIIREFLAQEN